MRAEGKSSCRCSRGFRVKGQPSGAFLTPAAENPSGGRTAAEDPSAERGGDGSVARSRHVNLPSSREELPELDAGGRLDFDLYE